MSKAAVSTLPGLPSASRKRAKRNELDRYLTPASAIHSLLAGFPEIGGGVGVEPCSGGGVMADLIRSRFRRLITNDCDRRISADFHEDATRPVLYEMVRDAEGPISWVVTNPPFAHWHRILRQCIEQGIDCALLLRITALEVCKNRPWLADHRPQTIQILGRVRFRSGGSDNSPHCWAIWSKRTPPGIFYPPQDRRQQSLCLAQEAA